MRALARLSRHVDFGDAARVEAWLTRGAVAGALGGLLVAVPAVLFEQLPAAPLAAAATAGLLFLLLPTQSPGVLLLVGGATALAALLSRVSIGALPYVFTTALGCFLALEHERWGRRALALVGPSVGLAWGLQVVAWLSARHLGGLPWLGPAAVLALGLFIALGALAAGASWSPDDVELRLRAAPRLVGTWSRLRVGLGRLPRGTARGQLEALVRAAAERWLAARVEAADVGASLDGELEHRTLDALTQLEARLEQTTDAGVADSLRHLARVHRDTLEQLDGLRRRKERLDAVAAAEVAWLETAAFTVELAPRSPPALLDVASRLEALSGARA